MFPQVYPSLRTFSSVITAAVADLFTSSAGANLPQSGSVCVAAVTYCGEGNMGI